MLRQTYYFTIERKVVTETTERQIVEVDVPVSMTDAQIKTLAAKGLVPEAWTSKVVSRTEEKVEVVSFEACDPYTQP